MKKSKILLIGIFAAFAVGFMSCGDDPVDEVKGPDVTVTVSSEDVLVGDTIDVVVNASTNENIVSIALSPSVGDKDEITYKPKDNMHKVTETLKYGVPEGLAAGTEIKLEVTVTDDKDAFTKAEVKLTVKGEAGPIATREAVMMYDLMNPNGGSFYSVAQNEVYSVADAAANATKIDLVYYYGATNKAVICAPNDEDVQQFEVMGNLETKNPTKLALTNVSLDDFNSMTDDSVILANVPSEMTTSVKDLNVHDIFYFKTNEGVQGLGYVSLIDGDAQGQSKIKLTLKVQNK